MTGRLVARHDLSATNVDAMRRLLDTFFAGVSVEQFTADLAEKNWVVLVERDGVLAGFSTLDVYETTVAGERLTVVRSGDTIVSPDAWGSAVFPHAWIGAVYKLRERYPVGRLVWLLLTSGYRTYRFLPVFWTTFYPRFDRPTPPAWQMLLDTLAADRYGTQFDAATGVVTLDRPQRLRGDLAMVPPHRANDPHVRFFLERNPGHGDGDELVSVADLAPANLTAAGRRVVFGTAR